MIELVCAVACALGAGLIYAGLLPNEPSGAASRARRGLWRIEMHLELFLRLAGSSWSRNEFVSVSLLAGTVSGVVAQLWLGWPLVSLVFGVCGVGLPAARYAPRARRQRAAEQAALVEFAAQLRSLLGSGGTSSVEVAYARLSRFGPVALRPELARTVRDMRRLHGGFPEALDRLRDRLADSVADQVVAASKHSYRLGGRGLGQLLDRLVESSRQTQDVRREAESRKTQAYLAAGVMCVLPAITLVAVRTIAPDYLAIYDDPAGQLWLVASAVWLALGVVVALWVGRLPKAERIFR